MVRKTISLTEDLARRLDAVAERRGLSFSAAVTHLLEEVLADAPLPYEASGEGPEDLGRCSDAYLDELARERNR